MDLKISSATPSVERVEFESICLGRTGRYTAILPGGLPLFGERKVLFLLHGLFGSDENWTANTAILEYVRNFDFIIICPDAGDGWYTDRDAPAGRYESYILDEVIPHAEGHYGCAAGKRSRAVAGISMGGYGAFKFALRRPEEFCFAGSMSGAFHAAEAGDADANTEIIPSINQVFGNDAGLRSRNSLPQMIAQITDPHSLPYFYFDCGTGDPFITANRMIAGLFAAQSIEHTFNELPGGHDWEYWNEHLSNLLKAAEKAFQHRC